MSFIENAGLRVSNDSYDNVAVSVALDQEGSFVIQIHRYDSPGKPFARPMAAVRMTPDETAKLIAMLAKTMAEHLEK